MYHICPTGTRVYGPAREDSDYDFVMPYWEAAKLEDFLVLAGVEYEEQSEINPQYRGFKFKFGNIDVQIICAIDIKDFRLWQQTTNALSLIDTIEDRNERIKKFNEKYSELEAEYEREGVSE